METITKTKKITKKEEVSKPESKNIEETKVPDLSYFEEESIIDYDDGFFLSAIDSIQVPKPGSVYDARYIGMDDTHFLLDADFKDLVRIPKTTEESNFVLRADVNDILPLIVTDITDKKDFSINGSVAHMYRQEAFKTLDELKDNEYVMVHIDELTGAGYNCTIDTNGCIIGAFLPQILAGVNKIHDDEKEELVGQELEMCVESYAPDQGTWIVSRRKYLKQLIPAYIDNLEKDVDYTGTVTGTAKFGVFVEFNDCLTGMIHRSNLTDELKKNFDNIKPGDEVTFNVKEIFKGNKIILTQVETTSLWDTISVGQNLDGTIMEHKPFGTLIILDHETLGLIHSSEQVKDIKDMKKGDKVNVKVLAINRSERKIYLTNN